MKDTEIVLLLARLTATCGQIMFLAKGKQDVLQYTWAFLLGVCHAMEAIKRALQEE